MGDHDGDVDLGEVDLSGTFDDAGATDSGGSPQYSGSSEIAKPHHFPCFDGLRAIAALLVVFIHTGWVSGYSVRSSFGIYTSRMEIGVSVFFLISGFLLYRPFAVSHLTNQSPPATLRFWERRLLRIVPAYWLALTLLVYVFHLTTIGPGFGGPLSHYLFLQIYLPTQAFYGMPQTWSLCTEMSFYFFLPLYAVLVSLWARGTHRRLVRELVGVVVLIAVSVIWRVWALNIPYIKVVDGKFVATCTPHCYTSPALSSLLPSWLPSYLDLFGLGILLAVLSVWWSHRSTEPQWLGSRWFPWASWGGAAVAFFAVSHLGIPRSPLYVVTPLVNIERQGLYGLFAFLLLLPAVFGHQDDGSLVRRFLRCWPMVSLGVISYGIYLWHLNLIDEVMKWGHWGKQAAPFLQLTLGTLAITIVAATVSYFALEKPILRVKGRIGWWRRSSV